MLNPTRLRTAILRVELLRIRASRFEEFGMFDQARSTEADADGAAQYLGDDANEDEFRMALEMIRAAEREANEADLANGVRTVSAI